MIQARVLGLSLFAGLVGLFSISASSSAQSELASYPVTATYPFAVGLEPFESAVYPEPFDSTQGRFVEGKRPAQGGLVKVIPTFEGSQQDLPSVTVMMEEQGRFLLELRRESRRYPDWDLSGRLVESATECPPLFE